MGLYDAAQYKGSNPQATGDDYLDAQFQQGATSPTTEEAQNQNEYFNNAPNPAKSDTNTGKDAAKTGADAAGTAMMGVPNPWVAGAGVALKVGSSFIDSEEQSKGQKAQEQMLVDKANVQRAAWRSPYDEGTSEAIAKNQGRPGGMAASIAQDGMPKDAQTAMSIMGGGSSNPRQVAANEAELIKQEQEIQATRNRRRIRLQRLAPLMILPFAASIRRVV
jgi:hypothetical protein